MASTDAARSERLAAARRAGKLMRESDFRESLATAPSGEARVIAATLEEKLGDVFSRVDRVGLPTTICVPLGSASVASVVLSKTTEEEEDGLDTQGCGPDATVGMLLSVLVQHGEPMRISIQPPAFHADKSGHVQLAFA